MADATIELNLPPEIYERARQIARTSNRSVEAVLIESLTLLLGELPDTDLQPDELKTFTDAQLWAIVHQHLAWPQDSRLNMLLAKGKQGILSDAERAEMERLMALVDHQMVLRSEALLLLKQRGHNVEAKLNLGA
jgi:hypothetical protein